MYRMMRCAVILSSLTFLLYFVSNLYPQYGSIAPGPGAYNLRRDLGKQGAGGMTINIGGVEVVLGGNNGTSSFASKAARPHQRVST